MSHTGCQKCGKSRHDHFDDHGHHDFHHHDHDHHDHHDKNFHDRDFICDRFLCDSDFRLRLGGLQGGLNFRLRQLIGCVVKLELEESKKITAKICFVGSDFVEVDVIDEKKEVPAAENKIVPQKNVRRKRKRRKKVIHGRALIIPFESIKFVELQGDCDCK